MCIRDSNKKCVDCSVMDSTHTSVDFGVFICHKCAAYHTHSNINCSPVMELDKEPLNIKQQKFLEKGGNLAFKNFMTRYDLNDQIPEIKYVTVAADFYRARLKAIVEEKEFFEKVPGFEDGKELVNERIGAEENKSNSALSYLTSGFTSTLNACLLYTSPSPRDLSTSRMPSSA
eukprot:TRINITY_DN26037_c0_g1_i2.p2 TRINITY_DN26037_c0_g1~~TRINITY_DN26037_c0_g1_i2.p2  ORF type:complete len:174 (-),score=26.37 TRINITY_DN26037_c0_g1_i2:123-644(-)